jgi:8-oxo-dGTP diphosphatase
MRLTGRCVSKPVCADCARLLGDEFTLRELRLAHEAVAGQALQRDWFRRAMERHLVATGTTTTGTRGKPAELFQRRKRRGVGKNQESR